MGRRLARARTHPGAVVASPAESAPIVGHNPGVSELAQALVPGFEQNLPTGAVVEIDLAVDTWAGLRRGGGSLRSYDYPKNAP